MWINSGDRVLDIGCGQAAFARSVPNARYTGLEPNHVSTVPTETGGVHILTDNIARHAMTHAQCYDVVCAFQVLEHLAEPKKFLTAALTCLKPGGLLILGVPNANSYITKMANVVLNAPPHHVTWWTEQALSRLAKDFQLEVVDVAHAPVEHWETRLYWMQKLSTMIAPHPSSHFTPSIFRRMLTISTYFLAGLINICATPSTEDQGASLVFVAKKPLLNSEEQ